LETRKDQELLDKYFQKAVVYYGVGDVYHAVKLFKRLVKVAPTWVAPFEFLADIYTERQEWKPALHYSQKVLALDEQKPSAWLSVAMAATALKRWKKARNAWNEIGYQLRESSDPIHIDYGKIALKIKTNKQIEILEAQRIGPARAIIQSIPQIKSEFGFGMIVMIDPESKEKYVAPNGQSFPVYTALEIWKLTAFKNYTAFLEEASESDIDVLYNLCINEGIGFDNWSNASRTTNFKKTNEYLAHLIKPDSSPQNQLVAFSAYNQKTVEAVLKNWKIITLGNYNNLQRLT